MTFALKPKTNQAKIFVGHLHRDFKKDNVQGLLDVFDKSAEPLTRDKKNCSAFAYYDACRHADKFILWFHNSSDPTISCDTPLQVSYTGNTDIISDFGFDHGVYLHKDNKSNPIPKAIPPRFTPNASGRCSYWDAANSHDDLEGCAVVCFSTDAATVREMNMLAGYTYSSVHEGAGVTTVDFVSTGEADRAIREHHGAAATGGAPLRVSYDYAATSVISDFGFDHFMFLGQQDAARRRLEDPKHKWMLGPGELPPRLQQVASYCEKRRRQTESCK